MVYNINYVYIHVFNIFKCTQCTFTLSKKKNCLTMLMCYLCLIGRQKNPMDRNLLSIIVKTIV